MIDVQSQYKQDIQYIQNVMPVRGSFSIFSNYEKLMEIIKRTPDVINCEDYSGRTLLDHAVELHETEAIMLIMGYSSSNSYINLSYD